MPVHGRIMALAEPFAKPAAGLRLGLHHPGQYPPDFLQPGHGDDVAEWLAVSAARSRPPRAEWRRSRLP